MAPPKTYVKSSVNMMGCNVVKKTASGVRTRARRLRFVMVAMSATTHVTRLP